MNTVDEKGLITEPCVCEGEYKESGYCLTIEDPNTDAETQIYTDFSCATASISTCDNYCGETPNPTLAATPCDDKEKAICEVDVCGVADEHSQTNPPSRGKHWACVIEQREDTLSSGYTGQRMVFDVCVLKQVDD